MHFEDAQKSVRSALTKARALGFDHVSFTLAANQRQGTRIALGTICRENAFSETLSISVEGVWNNRHGAFTIDFDGEDTLVARLQKLRTDLANLPEDREWVPYPSVAQGRRDAISDKPCLDEAYAPALVFPALERHIAPIRDSGLRVSGFVRALESRRYRLTSAGVEMNLHDNGLQVKFAVDNPKTLASGCGTASLASPSASAIDGAIARALREAHEFAQLSENPAEIEPGDYPTLFHHTAVADLLPSLSGYGLFERRAIDEGRTYLSKAMDTLRFPQGLTLEFQSALESEGQRIASAPLTRRGLEPTPVRLIHDGRIADTLVSPYWASKTGLKETSAAGLPGTLHRTTPSAQDQHTWRDLVATMERGIFVNSLWYIRMVSRMDGILTGMTRDGIYEVRDGRIFRALRNMRWHENPIRALERCSGMTRELRLHGISANAGGNGGMFVPAMKVDSFHFSSVTRF